MNTRPGDIQIRISELSNGLHEYHFLPPASDLGLERNFHKPIAINATMEKRGGQLYVTAEVKTSAIFECDRCVEEFEQDLAARYTKYYVFDELEIGNFSDDGVRVLSPDTHQLDLTEDMRETVMLSVPLKLLCAENCQGLCPRCGVNLNRSECKCKEENIDTRWESLKKFLDQ